MIRLIDLVDALVLALLAGALWFVPLFAAMLAWHVPWTLAVSAPTGALTCGAIHAIMMDYAAWSVDRDWPGFAARRR